MINGSLGLGNQVNYVVSMASQISQCGDQEESIWLKGRLSVLQKMTLP